MNALSGAARQKGGRRKRIARRIIAIVLIAAGLSPGLFWRTSMAPDYANSRISIRELDVPNAKFGPLKPSGLWQLEGKSSAFGGYSALVARDGGFLAGSDAGSFLRFSTPAASGAFRAAIVPLHITGSGGKRDSDLESLTIDPKSGAIWGGFEVLNAIARFSPDLVQAARAAPPAMANWSENSGPEALVRLKDGRFIAISEHGEGPSKSHHKALLFPYDPTLPAEPVRFAVRIAKGFSPVDMSLLEDGRVLILLRRFSLGLPPHFDTALALGDPADIKPDGLWTPKLVARLKAPLASENFEGVATVKTGPESCSVWLISDDNFSAFQRTLLLRLDWPACNKAEESPRPNK